jgi:hypothetical protein
MSTTSYSDRVDVSYPKKYFVVTNGRSGSSLLSAILADVGANFGIAPPQNWDPREAQMENPAINRAAHQYRRAYDIDQGRGYTLLPAYEAKWRRRRGRRDLSRALPQADYFKSGDMDLLAQPAFRLGYLPQLILIYRRCDENLQSMLVGRTHSGPDELAADYLRIYRQALLLARCFGGCAVSFEQLTDARDSRWAEALGQLTGLPLEGLLAARGRRIEARPARPASAGEAYPELDSLYRHLETLAGHAFAPAEAVLRAVKAR